MVQRHCQFTVNFKPETVQKQHYVSLSQLSFNVYVMLLTLVLCWLVLKKCNNSKVLGILTKVCLHEKA